MRKRASSAWENDAEVVEESPPPLVRRAAQLSVPELRSRSLMTKSLRMNSPEPRTLLLKKFTRSKSSLENVSALAPDKSPLSLLPKAVIFRILGYLTPIDLVRISKTCKYWMGIIVKDDPNLSPWKNLLSQFNRPLELLEKVRSQSDATWRQLFIEHRKC